MAKSAVYAARKSAQEVKFRNLRSNDQRSLLFKEARRVKGENQDIVGDKCMRDDDGNLVVDEQKNIIPEKHILRDSSMKSSLGFLMNLLTKGPLQVHPCLLENIWYFRQSKP